MIHRHATSRRRAAGLSIVETLVSLALAGVLMAAIMVALDVSFHAYATAAETASTSSSSRLVMQRLMGMIRSGALHDAYDPDDADVSLEDPSVGPIHTVGIQLYDYQGNLVRVWWTRPDGGLATDPGTLWYTQGASTPAPLLEGVVAQIDADTTEPYLFTLQSRASEGGLLLSRATVDLTVEPGADATLSLEAHQGAGSAVRLVASTAPRKNID